MIGRVLGENYRILRALGYGANGAVYLATDLREHRKRAVKQIMGHHSVEAELLQHLRHEHIVQVIELLTEEDESYLVCEYIAGMTLEQAAHEYSELNEQQVLMWGIELAEALIYLHDRENPVVHRDIKPGNIMITKEQKLKLIDFGIAEELCAQNGSSEQTKWSAYGSVGFAAPEQYGDRSGKLHKQIDTRTDIYAVGKTLAYVVAQRQLRIGIGLHLIIHRCTMQSAERRFRTAKQLRRALQLVLAVGYPRSRRILFLLGLGVALCLSLYVAMSSKLPLGISDGYGTVEDIRENDKLQTNMRETAGTAEGATALQGTDVAAERRLPEIETERFWDSYAELRVYMQDIKGCYDAAKPSAAKYNGLYELSCMCVPFAETEEEAAAELFTLLGAGYAELEKYAVYEKKPGMSEGEYQELFGRYCRLLFFQYRILGQQKLQQNPQQSTEELAMAVEYGERAYMLYAGEDGEQAVLLCDLGRVYRQLNRDEEALSCYRRGVQELEYIPEELYLAYLELLLHIAEQNKNGENANSSAAKQNIVKNPEDIRQELLEVYEQAAKLESVVRHVRFEQIRLQMEQIMEEEMD